MSGEVLRDSKGRLLPGQTLNPGGRSKQVKELLALARQSVPRALELASTYIDDDLLDARVRLDAAKLVLSYGLGAPPRLDQPEDDPDIEALKAMSDEQLDRLIRRRGIAGSEPLDSSEPIDSTGVGVEEE